MRALKVERPNQVWAMDITYLPMPGGFMYLTAIIDLYARYVVGWSISNTMDAYWCKATLDQAINKYGKPEILNTDQGSQFTSKLFVNGVKNHQTIRFSMDGKGRCIDNVFIERLWWSVKYENVYIRAYENGKELHQGLTHYFNQYNHERRHAGINDELPSNRYFSFNNSSPRIWEFLEEKYLKNFKSA